MAKRAVLLPLQRSCCCRVEVGKSPGELVCCSTGNGRIEGEVLVMLRGHAESTCYPSPSTFCSVIPSFLLL